MQKIGILLLGTILIGGGSIAQADSWQSGKYGSTSKGSQGQNTIVYSKGNKGSVNVGRNITYGPQRSKNKQAHKTASSKLHVKKVVYASPKKVVYVSPKYKSQSKKHSYKKHSYKSYRPKYIYVKTAYAPRYYGHHPYRGFYWPFVNVRFVVDLTARQIEHHHQALYTALDRPVGHVTSWRDGGRSGSIVILRSGYDAYGNLCKQYRQTLTYRGRTTTSVEESCLSQSGYWTSV